MIRKLLATTAVTALIASGAYAQQPETDDQQVQQQDQQVQQQDQLAQAQQEITVSSGDTVVIESDREDAEINLRIQAAVTGTQQQGMQQDQQAVDEQAAAQDGLDQDGVQQQAQTEQAAPADEDQQVAEDQQQDQEIAQDQPADTLDRGEMEAADAQQLSVDELIGTDVHSAQDENIGNINDVLLTQDGEVDAIVVDVGGFLGMGAHEVAIGMDDIDFMTDAQGNLYAYTPYTREQLEGAPEYDQATWTEQRDEQRLTGDMAAQIQPQDQQVQQQDQQVAQDQQVQQQDVTQQPGQMQEHVVMDGGTVIVQAEEERFQLSFEIRRTDDEALAQREADTETTAAAPAEPDPEETAAIDRDQRQPVEMGEIRADDLIGSTVYGVGDDNIGNVGDIILTEGGEFDAIIVDVGGFLGIGTREVALGLDEVQFMRDDQNNWFIYTQYTQEQLEAAPEYDPATYAERRDEQRVGIQDRQQ